MVDFEIYKQNEKQAYKLQKKHGLTETLRDLYAWEVLTADEVVNLQEYKNRVQPEYTGNYETDKLLAEAFTKKITAMNLTESVLTDICAKELYESGCLELHEAFELQRFRTLLS